MFDLHRLYLLIMASCLIVLTGCGTTMVITPDLKPNASIDFRVNGKVLYEGNHEYLPRTAVDSPASESGLVFRYTYNVIYGKDNVSPLLPLFNPLTVVGFPIGGDTIVITGQMEILKGNEVVKTYTAFCGFGKKRSIFSEGDTFSELRRKGLIAVRDNIETQMNQDQEFLSKLVFVK